MTSDSTPKKFDSDPVADLENANVDADTADNVKGGFDPQPEPPGRIRAFDPQPDPPFLRNNPIQGGH